MHYGWLEFFFPSMKPAYPWPHSTFPFPHCTLFSLSVLSLQLAKGPKAVKLPNLATCVMEIQPTMDAVVPFMVSNVLEWPLPNMGIPYRRYMIVSSTNAEHSFSHLQLIKNYLWSCMKEARWSNLTLLATDRDRVAFEVWNELDVCILLPNVELFYRLRCEIA